MRTRRIELMVGLFMIAGLVALLVLAFKVSGLIDVGNSAYYTVTAEFDNVGNLKVHAPVALSGVQVGEVTGIAIDNHNLRAVVTFGIDKRVSALPSDTSASILTRGILGSNYIGLTPGFESSNLHNGDRIETTHSALILENLIGQLIYNVKDTMKESNGPAKSPSESQLGAP